MRKTEGKDGGAEQREVRYTGGLPFGIEPIKGKQMTSRRDSQSQKRGPEE